MTKTAMCCARDFAFSTLLIAAVACVGLSAQADAPEALPPGMAKYVVALWTPGLPLPGGGHVKKVKEPDIEKLGGRVLATDDNRKTILLPKAAARELRKHSAVIYLQRIWMGESLDDWDERFEPNNSGFGISSHSDENIDWVRSYEYDGSGNITKVDVTGVVADDHYTYDSAGRLIRAAVGGKVETYQYDDFGNLINKAVAGSNPVSVPIDSATNRITGSEYDLAGNVVQHGFHAYEYDALNMLTRIKLTGPVLADRRMIYDADDEKIGTVQVASGLDALSRWTIRDFGGRVLREYRGENGGFGIWIWQFDYLYTGAGLVAGESVEWKDPAEDYQLYGGERHYHLDHLGSVRIVTNGVGRSLSEHDYFPFGRTMTRTQQEAVDPYDSHIDPMRFAGHARDFLGVVNAENPEYLDYMHARYYDPRLGRFLSVDPFLDTAIALKNPQGWNRYAYVRNNPINKTDPTGKCEDPKPNGGGTRICIQAFIPTKTFTGFVGDNRKAQSNGGTFRTNQSIMFSNNGKATAPPLQPGVSAIAAAPKIARTAVVADQGVNQVAPGVVQARGAASDGLGFGLAPNLSYNFTIGVDKGGNASVLGGKHSGYPAFEVWSYRDGQAPDLLYTYNPSRKDAFGGFLNISAVTVDVESQVPSLDPNVP